jgi:MtN3 and saliva related transmembrane protein
MEGFMTEGIGWLSSFILVLTIGKQVHKQWRSGSSEGVPKWLFVGQITASTGFTLYSILEHNWVFVVTNALLLVSAIAGGLIVLKHRRTQRIGSSEALLRGEALGPVRKEGWCRVPPAACAEHAAYSGHTIAWARLPGGRRQAADAP